jgi:uptake hydrogenase large subunit
MGPEGELRLSLALRHSGPPLIDTVHIRSSRPDVASTMLQGRGRDVVRQLMPRLFTACAVAQSTACELALQAAAGGQADTAQLQRCAEAVGLEAQRETALHFLLDAPQAIGERPNANAIAAARSVVADLAIGKGLVQIEAALWAVSAPAWLALDAPALQAWAEAGATASARLLRCLCADEAQARACETALLCPDEPRRWLPEWVQSLEGSAGFARLPRWRGACAETGALARQQSDNVVAAWLRAHPARLGARCLARLRELAMALCGMNPTPLGALPLGPSRAVAWVDTARGLLVHAVQLERDRVQRYHIVAPTEWNFHPQGALASALPGLWANDLAALTQRVRRWVDSLDPCVPCQIEFNHA